MRKSTFIALLLALCLSGCGGPTIDATAPAPETTAGSMESETPVGSSEVAVTEVTAAKSEQALPLDTSGGLRIVSLFPYTGINPDAGDEPCTDVIGAEIVNMSGQYLAQADLELLFTDGSTLTLRLRDIPPDATVYAFDALNRSAAQIPTASEIRESADFSDAAAIPDDFSAETEGLLIRIKAVGTSASEQITVVYHGVLDGILFGGLSYSQTIPAPKSDSEAQLTAEECIFGEAQVVCVRK